MRAVSAARVIYLLRPIYEMTNVNVFFMFALGSEISSCWMRSRRDAGQRNLEMRDQRHEVQSEISEVQGLASN